MIVGRWSWAVGRPALASVAALLLAAVVGGVGYRLGVTSDAGAGPVLTDALVSRPVAAVKRPAAPQAKRKPSVAVAHRLPPIVAPESVMGPLAPPAPTAPRERVRPRVAGPEKPATVAQTGPAPERAPVGSAPSGRYLSKRSIARERRPPVLPPADELDSWTTEVFANSRHVANALQSSIEETARQQVTDEVALLAQALTRTEPTPADPERGEQKL
jgi:hypothetical protein